MVPQPGVRGSRDGVWGGRDWLLLGMILLSFIVIPGVIAFAPPTWVSFRFAYLIMPVIPALALAAIAVWAGLGHH